jgi:hypothetical protein
MSQVPREPKNPPAEPLHRDPTLPRGGKLDEMLGSWQQHPTAGAADGFSS